MQRHRQTINKCTCICRDTYMYINEKLFSLTLRVIHSFKLNNCYMREIFFMNNYHYIRPCPGYYVTPFMCMLYLLVHEKSHCQEPIITSETGKTRPPLYRDTWCHVASFCCYLQRQKKLLICTLYSAIMSLFISENGSFYLQRETCAGLRVNLTWGI